MMETYWGIFQVYMMETYWEIFQVYMMETYWGVFQAYMMETDWGMFQAYFKRRKCFHKNLLQFLENSQKFIPAKSKVNRELQKFFPGKRSSLAKP